MLEIIIDDDAFLASADIGIMETDVFNDARSEPSPSGRWGGFAYFNAVDQGRGPVKPIYAKALRIVLPNGDVIFRKSVGPSAPRNIRVNSLVQLESSAVNASLTASGDSLRGWIASFLNKMAYFYSQVLADATPRGASGKLGSSYRPTIIG
jgi:hypothetical protein